MEPEKRKLIADACFVHDGELVQVGDEFEATDEEAKELCSYVIQVAHYANAERDPIRRTYRRRDMKVQH